VAHISVLAHCGHVVGKRALAGLARLLVERGRNRLAFCGIHLRGSCANSTDVLVVYHRRRTVPIVVVTYALSANLRERDVWLVKALMAGAAANRNDRAMKYSRPESTTLPSFPDLEALLRLQERLLHVSRMATVGEMSSGIAHELNQPLCAVANYAQACDRLLALPDPDIGEVRDSLQEIAAQALRAGEVIRRLRNLARPPRPSRELADINTLIAELADLIQADTKHNQVRYHFEAGLDLPHVLVDRSQIQQLVLNLVRNSVEAVAEQPEEAREVTVRTARTHTGDVEISVSDHGPGVSATVAPRLFTPFCTSKPAGTGLGLAMSRTIAGAHDGNLDYHPNVPTGACFTLTLPAARVAH
jgi:C4-dicarboxylate-specific signal transduction histidine kinase